MFRQLVISAAVLAVVAGTGGAAAGAGLPRRYSADAFFRESAGCEQTAIGVFPVAVKDRRAPQAGASMSVQYDQFDTCTATPLLQANVSTPLSPGQFVISPGLTTASLRADAVLRDALTGRDIPLRISVDYRIAGPRAEVCTEQVSADEVVTFCGAVATGVITQAGQNLVSSPATAVFQEHRPRTPGAP